MSLGNVLYVLVAQNKKRMFSASGRQPVGQDSSMDS